MTADYAVQRAGFDVDRLSDRRRTTRERRGGVLVLLAVSLVGVLGFLVLAIDVGSLHRERRILQTAADAGALGGAAEIYRERSDLVVGSSRTEVTRNGLTNGTGNDAVTVSYPPVTGPRTWNYQYVEVVVQRSVPAIFAGVFGVNLTTIQTRAVAGVGAPSRNCVFAIDPDALKALDVSGTLTSTCGVVVNSSHPSQAAYVKPGANLIAASVSVTGGINDRGDVEPAVQTGAPPAYNPLTNLEIPEVPLTCDYNNLNVNGTVTLNPGTYCGGITVRLSSNKALLNPGVYFMRGGGLTVENSGWMIGSGVTIINTDGPSPFKPITFGNGCKAELTAPTEGALAGILMLQDPGAGSSSDVNTMACSNDVPFTGTLYFPTQKFYSAGSNSSTTIMGSLIARLIEVKTGTQLAVIPFASGPSALKRLSLVE